MLHTLGVPGRELQTWLMAAEAESDFGLLRMAALPNMAIESSQRDDETH